MILRGFLYLICFALVITFNVMNDGYIPFIVDVAFISLSVISITVLIILRKKITVEYDKYFETVERDSDAIINILIKNDSFIPLPMCKFKAVSVFKDGKKKTKHLNAYCNPHGNVEVFFNMKHSFCETFKIRITRVYISDFFQLITVSKKTDISMEVLVLPKPLEQHILNAIKKDMDRDNDYVYSDTRAGDDPSEIYAIREYAAGDKIRNIHWKLTSKVNEVMVKDYGLPLFEKDTVVVDIFSMKDDKNKKIINEVYDLLYGLIHTMTARGTGIMVCFVNTEYRVIRIESENDINNFFAELYECPPIKVETAAELYYANHNKVRNRVFYVTDHMNDDTVNRMRLLEETGPVYYLIPQSTGGGQYLVKFD